MKKYLDEKVADEADNFDKHVGGSVRVLRSLGVCAVPDKKSALLFHWLECQNININFNLTRSIMWLDNLEEGLQKVLRKG